MKEQIKELEQKIQNEIWRIQMIDYPSLPTNDYLDKMQDQLKELKPKYLFIADDEVSIRKY